VLRSVSPSACGQADVERGIVGGPHSMPAAFPGTQDARRSPLGGPVRTVGTCSSSCGLPSKVRAGDHLGASPLRSIAGIGHGGFVRHENRGRAGPSGGRSDAGLRVRRVGGQMAERSSGVWPAAFSSCQQAEPFGRIVRVHHRGPRLARAHTCKAGRICHRSLGQPVQSVGSASATAR
jgi:hypothetical protein